MRRLLHCGLTGCLLVLAGSAGAPPELRFDIRQDSISPVRALVFSPDGKTVVSADSRGFVYQWDAVAGPRLIGSAKLPRPASLLARSVSGVIAASADDGSVYLVTSGPERLTGCSATGPNGALAFSGDGQYLAVFTDDSRICLFDVATRKLTTSATLNAGPVRAVSYAAPDHLTFMAGAGAVNSWDIKGGLKWTPPPAHVVKYQFSSDATKLARLGGDRVEIFNVTDGAPLVSRASDRVPWLFSGDLQVFTSSSRLSGEIGLFDSASGAQKAMLKGIGDGAAFSPGGHLFATIETGHHDVLVHDLRDGTDWRANACASPLISYELVFSSDSRWLAVSCIRDRIFGLISTDRVFVLDVQSRSPVGLFNTSEADQSALSAAAGIMAVSGAGSDKLEFWDLKKSKHIATVRGSTTRIIRFSGDGSKVARTGFGSLVGMWDSQGHPLGFATIPGIAAFEFDDRGGIVAMADNGKGSQIYRWQTDGQPVATGVFLPPIDSGRVLAASFSPDGKLLVRFDAGNNRFETLDVPVIASKTSRAQITNTGKGTVFHAAAVTDKGLIATGASDGSIAVWTRQETSAVAQAGHKGAVRAVAFSPTAPVLASAGDDGTVRFWNVANPKNPQLVATAYSLANSEYLAASDTYFTDSPKARDQYSIRYDNQPISWDAAAQNLRRNDVFAANRESPPAAVVAQAAPAPPAAPVIDYLAVGKTAYGSGDYAKARQALGQVAKDSAQYQEAQSWLSRIDNRDKLAQARAALDKKQYDTAILLFRQMLAVTASDGDMLVPVTLGLHDSLSGKAGALLQAKSFDAAFAQYEDLNDLNGERDALYGKALAQIAAKDWPGAKATLEKLQKLGIGKYSDVASRTNAVQAHIDFDGATKAFGDRQYAPAAQIFAKLKALPDLPADMVQPVAEGYQKAQAEALYQVGQKFLNDRQYASAQTQFNAVLGIDPNHKGARDGLAFLQDLPKLEYVKRTGEQGQERLKQGDWAGAKRYFGDILKVNPTDAQALAGLRQAEAGETAVRNRIIGFGGSATLGIGVALLLFYNLRLRAGLLMLVGARHSAARTYQSILVRDSGSLPILQKLIEVQTLLGRRQTLELYVGWYLKEKPGDAAMLFEKGELLFERGAFAKAREAFDAALKAGYDADAVLQKLGALPSEFPPTRESVELYERQLASNPEARDWNLFLGSIYMSERRTDEDAVRVYRKTFDAAPDWADRRLISARGHLGLGEFSEAFEDVRTVLERDRKRSDAWALLGDLALQNGILDRAAELLASPEAPNLEVLSAWETLAATDGNRRAAAHREYEARAERLPERSPVRALFLAHIAIDDERLTEARALFQQALGSKEGSPQFLRETIRVGRRIAKDAPETEPDLWKALGDLHARSGDWRQALGLYEAIVRIPQYHLPVRGAMEAVLDTLPPADVAQKFFSDAQWTWEQRGGDAVARPRVEALATSLKSSFVRAFDQPLTFEDVFRLKETRDGHGAIFAVVRARPRQDVYAVIYALLAEQPSTTIIPLETSALKEAIVALNAGGVLRDTLDQWLGGRDLYEAHNPIADAATFFGRGRFIQQLTNKALAGENFGLYGLRKVGKTSLVFQLRESMPHSVLVAYVDLQATTSNACDEIYFRLIQALRQEFAVKRAGLPMPDLRLQTFEASMSYPDVASDFSADLMLLRKAAESGGEPLRVLLLIDEVETMIPHGEWPGLRGHQDFFRYVRGLYQEHRFVVSAVVGADPSLCRAGRWGDRDNPVFQYYDEVFLTPLESSECAQMVRGLGSIMGLDYDEASLALIFEESGGHPYVARQLCSSLVQRHSERPLAVDETMVREAVEDYLAQRPDYFRGILEGYVSASARKILEDLCRSDRNEKERGAILEFAAQSGLGRDDATRALQDLELFHVLRRKGDVYSIQIRLLRRWIRSDWLGLPDLKESFRP